MVAGLSNVTLNTAAQQLNRQRTAGFSAQGEEKYYNPVDPGKEKAIACIGPTVLSLGLGTGAGFAAFKLIPKIGKKWSIAIGAAVAAVSAIMTIPAAIYSANVNASMRKEQYNPFEADQKAQTTLQRQLQQTALNNPDDLSKNADIAMKLGIAKRGNAMAIMTPNN